jgi:predicted aldo/keto reductase-like oxidoreductase
MHGLTNPVGWAKAMGPDGTLEAFLEARDEGLVRFLGVTGHGTKVPAMHKQSLERFGFDSILLPYNYLLMKNPRYAADFTELVKICERHNVSIQTMKAIAHQPIRGQSPNFNTYFYEPLETKQAIGKTVHWSLGFKKSFLISVGDMQLLPKFLDAATRFLKRPIDSVMDALVDEYGMQQIFP